jgi:hypothetical protein
MACGQDVDTLGISLVAPSKDTDQLLVTLLYLTIWDITDRTHYSA